MKKNQVQKVTDTKQLKKLRLSRETLHTLTSSDTQNVVGGIVESGDSPPSPLCPTTVSA